MARVPKLSKTEIIQALVNSLQEGNLEHEVVLQLPGWWVDQYAREPGTIDQGKVKIKMERDDRCPTCRRKL